MLNNIDTNNFISETLKNDNSIFIGRSGIIELRSCFFYSKYKSLPSQLLYLLKNNAGGYGDKIIEFFEEYLNAISLADLNVYWVQEDLKETQNYLYDTYSPSCIRFENRGVEPYYFNSPWSQYLENKKVLIIHPFKQSIDSQYVKKKLLWNNNILPDFQELLTYQSIQSIGDSGPHSSWIESLNIMKQEIERLDFDIALIGCGAYGLPLGAHIKSKMKKRAIHMGGALQILFGIKGYRWDNHDEISKLYNQYWIRPLETEKPKAYKTVEQGCYW